MNRSIPMVDTSKWQSSNQAFPPVRHFSCRAAATQGVKGAYIKATIAAGGMDPEWDDVYPCWGGSNIKRGNYHWFTAGIPGTHQANWYLSQVRENRGELPMAIDAEVSGLYAREIWAFVRRIYEVERRYPLIYTGPWAWSQVIDGRSFEFTVPVTYKLLIARHCELWQAQYPKIDDGKTVPRLYPIPGWSVLKKEPVMHQFSCKAGVGKRYGSQSYEIDLNLADATWFDLYPWPGQIPVTPDPLPLPPVLTPGGWQLRAGASALNIRERPYRSDPAPKILRVIRPGEILQLKSDRDGSWAPLAEGPGWVNVSYLVEVGL